MNVYKNIFLLAWSQTDDTAESVLMRGPVESCAFSWLARIWCGEDIGMAPWVGLARGIGGGGV